MENLRTHRVLEKISHNILQGGKGSTHIITLEHSGNAKGPSSRNSDSGCYQVNGEGCSRDKG